MGVDIEYLVKKYGTPLYVYDFNQITKRYLELKEAFMGENL